MHANVFERLTEALTLACTASAMLTRQPTLQVRFKFQFTFGLKSSIPGPAERCQKNRLDI